MLFSIFVLLLTFNSGATAQILKSSGCKINFFSETPLENISAVSEQAVALLNLKTNEVAIQIPIKSFQFERSLMQEHFNENYMESDKYPLASFKGKIITPINLSNDGTYNVEVKGILNVHNVAQERTIKGKIEIKDNQVIINSKFDIACKDHHITIPSILFKKIAEVIQVNVYAQFIKK
ncbi:YceI family protein [Pedobacter sp. SD-b]|uniref:YceI family protein n=1 Tax=Pedobacter segetis TaxID=2793069 RepID=A0ABS1BGM9_9SPHI|nr:YceI family protein [Pedobacter segetis]MBK0382019.1 YceI family protein [Pedobacter segetis]